MKINDRGGSTVGGLVIIFIGCIMFVVLGLYFYEKREDEAYSKTLGLMTETNNAVKKAIEDKEAYAKRAEAAETEAKAATAAVAECSGKIAKFEEALDVFRDQVMDTREKQVKLREILATKKTQVVLPQGAIQVEILKSAPGPKIPPGPPPVPGSVKKGQPLGRGVEAVLKDQKNGKQPPQTRKSN